MINDAQLFSIIGVLIAFVVGILCYFLKGILDEMKDMNSQIIKVITNQEWHYKSILELQKKVADLESA